MSIVIPVLLIITLSISTCLGFVPATSLRVGLRTSQIDIFKGQLLRYIEKNFTDVEIPPFDEDLFFFRIRAMRNVVHVERVRPEQLKFTLLNDTSDFLMEATNLTTQGYSNVTIKLLFVTHRCKLVIMARRASFVARIGTKAVGDRLGISIKSMVYDIDPNEVEIMAVGGMIDNLLSSLVKVRKRFFLSEMKRCMLQILPQIMTNILNQILREVAVDFTDGSGASVKLAATVRPYITGDYMFGSLFAFAHRTGELDPPEYDIPELPLYNSTCHKGTQVFVSDYLATTVAETAHKVGLLKYNITATVLGFTADLRCKTSEAPTAIFNTTISANASVLCNLSITIPLSHRIIDIEIRAAASMLLREWTASSRIYFDLQQILLRSLHVDALIDVDFSLLLPKLNSILRTVVRPVLNFAFGKKGIPLPETPLFQLVDVDQEVQGRYVYVCTTLVPNFASIGGETDRSQEVM